MKLNYLAWSIMLVVALYHLIKVWFSAYYLNHAKKNEGIKNFEIIVQWFEAIYTDRVKNAKFWTISFLVYSIIQLVKLAILCL